MTPLPPGATLGLLGGGQLGRMFALAARPMGYRVHLLAPETESPATSVVDRHVPVDYLDLEAVQAFAQNVDAITYEFENIPIACVERAAQFVPVRPRPGVLAIGQHRALEKNNLTTLGLPVGPFRVVKQAGDATVAATEIGTPGVLKTATLGYDGKGQIRIDRIDQAETAWQQLGQTECVFEAWVAFEREMSVVVARDVTGNTAVYGPIENEHRNHILDVSVCPAPVRATISNAATQLARDLADKLDVVGVICVELFQQPDGTLLINEIAPRPHNSGHLTIEAHVTSQFAQQVRTVAGMPLGSDEQRCPAAMCNLLGDLWETGEPNWRAGLGEPDVALHLYQKAEPRRGRKMGHLTALGETGAEAKALAFAARQALIAS